MSNNIFTPMEIDAIGEIMNISLGSSATAVSNLLDHRVDITTPRVHVVNAEDFTLGELNPAIGVEIRYVAGLDGSNIMLLKMSDVKVIVDLLMGMETPDEEFELNDLTLSAVCEVMNQMMGSSSTALSDFLGRVVNISTPVTFDGSDIEMMRKKHLPVETGPIVVVSFALSIEGSMQSEFMNVMSVELAKELVSGFGLGEDEDSSTVLESEISPEESSNRPMSQAEIEAMFSGGGAAPAPAPSSGGGTLSQEEIERLMGGGATMAPAPSSGGGKLSQEEIERLMGGGAAPAPAPAPSSGGGKLSQEEIERLMAGAAAPAPQPAPAPAPSSGGGKLSQEEIERLMAGAAAAPPPQSAPQPAPFQQPMPQMQQPPQMPAQGVPPAGYYPPPYYGMMGPDGQPLPYPPVYMMPPNWSSAPSPDSDARPGKKADPKVVPTKAVSMPTLEDGTQLNEEQSKNLDLIMTVPLEISVEIGRTRKKVQDILTLSKGSLVVLDKLAGDQVDVYVNGKCIAHGDVVVIDDNFGIRISEIIHKPGLEDLL